MVPRRNRRGQQQNHRADFLEGLRRAADRRRCLPSRAKSESAHHRAAWAAARTRSAPDSGTGRDDDVRPDHLPRIGQQGVVNEDRQIIFAVSVSHLTSPPVENVHAFRR